MSKSNKKSNKFSEIPFDKSIVFTSFCFQIKFKILDWLKKQAAKSTISFVCVFATSVFKLGKIWVTFKSYHLPKHAVTKVFI